MVAGISIAMFVAMVGWGSKYFGWSDPDGKVQLALITSFILGVIGLLIPVMPQVLFFALSVFFLSLVSPTVRRWLRRFLRDHPKVAQAYKRWRDKGRQKRREIIRRRKELARKMHLHQ